MKMLVDCFPERLGNYFPSRRMSVLKTNLCYQCSYHFEFNSADKACDITISALSCIPTGGIILYS